MEPLPSWLLKDEAYRPPPGRESFTDANILVLLALLAKARRRAGGPRAAGGLDPRARVLGVLAILLLLAFSRTLTFPAVAGTGLLVLLACQRRECLAAVLGTALTAALFTLLILLPAALLGGGRSLALITAKVLVSVGSVKLLSETTEWAALSRAFRRLGAPALFVLVFDVALRYLTLLGELALDMLLALRARSVGRSQGKAASIAAIAGTLFLKSRDLAEATHAAMVCRGYGE